MFGAISGKDLETIANYIKQFIKFISHEKNQFELFFYLHQIFQQALVLKDLNLDLINLVSLLFFLFYYLSA